MASFKIWCKRYNKGVNEMLIVVLIVVLILVKMESTGGINIKQWLKSFTPFLLYLMKKIPQIFDDAHFSVTMLTNIQRQQYIQ